MQLFSPESRQTLMMLSGLGIICWLMMRGRTKRGRRFEPAVNTATLGHNSNVVGHSTAFMGTQSLGAPKDVLKWQVELHDLGRDLKAELDSKMIAVRALTQRYDLAANRLAEMIRLAEQVQVRPDSPVAVARQLASQGWSVARIADALSISKTEVEALLSCCAETAHSTNPRP